jgi:serine-type D-Ala-D-Ala carboxypeptidase (penicillin-binding protein 5/6)
MTAFVVLSSTHLDDVVVVPPEAVNQIGSTIGLRAGERLTIRDLLYGMLLPSANDAAVALARFTEGTVDAFVQRMNATASGMGLRDSHFASPTGLDNAGYSTARDLATLIRRAYRNDTFAHIVRTLRKRIPGPSGTTRHLVNANILLRVYPGAFGVKSGFTTPAGLCLAGAARLGGLGLLAVVLGSTTNAFDETIKLLNYGFGAFERVKLLSTGDQIGSLNVNGQPVEARSARDVFVVVARGQVPRVEIRFVPLNDVAARIESGDTIGHAEVRLGGKLVRIVPAVAAPVTTPAPSPPPPASGSSPPSAIVRALLFFAALIRAALNAFL